MSEGIRARITVEFWDSQMAYGLESIWAGVDPDPDTDEGRALSKALAMRQARFAAQPNAHDERVRKGANALGRLLSLDVRTAYDLDPVALTQAVLRAADSRDG